MTRPRLRRRAARNRHRHAVERVRVDGVEGDAVIQDERAVNLISTQVAALRRRKDAWRRGCAGEAARTVPGPPPDICGWFANEETWRAPRCVPDMWAAWCAVSRRLPFVD